jgi:thiosulfate dehydrogenase [quinone] large subunit
VIEESMNRTGITETESNLSDHRIAYAMLRLVVGVNLMMHGVSRIIAGTSAFAAKLVMQFEHTPMPAWSVWGFALMLPSLETLLGALILIGLRTRATLIAASLLIVILTFGSALVQDWSAAGTQLLYAAVYAALLFLIRYNGWSIDAWMKRR